MLLLGHEIGAAHVMPAKHRGREPLLEFLPHIEEARGARTQQPFVRVGGQEVHVLHRERHRAQRLDGIQAEEDAALAQGAAQRGHIQPPAADEMAGSQRHQPGLLVHLPQHVDVPNAPQFAHVHETHFDAAPGQGHPWIDVGGVIVVVDEDVVALAPGQPGRDEAQRQRGGSHQRDFLRPRAHQPRRRIPRLAQQRAGHGFLLVIQRAGARALRHRLRHAPGQRAHGGMGQEDLLLRHGELMTPQRLVLVKFSDVHGTVLMTSSICLK